MEEKEPLPLEPKVEPDKTKSRPKPQRQEKHRGRKKYPSGKKHSKATPQPWDQTQFQVKPQEDKTRFHDLEIPDEIMHGVADSNFKYCTPIQAEILQATLSGKGRVLSSIRTRRRKITNRTPKIPPTSIKAVLSK